METDPTTAVSVAPEEQPQSAPDAQQPAAQPEGGESGPQASAPSRQQISAGMTGWLRGAMGGPDATSKPTDGETAGESAPDPSGVVEAGGATPERGPDGRYLPRRAVPEVVRQAEERATAAERRAADAEARLSAQQQQVTQQATAAMAEQYRQEAELFDAATRMPDTDPRLTELVPNDPQGRSLYQWREDRKELIARYPEAEAALRADADQRASALDEERKSLMRQQIEGVAHREGVDASRWKGRADLTWDAIANDLLAAREARVRAEVQPQLDELAALRLEVQQLRPQALGAQRAPVAAGRSSSGVPASVNDAMNGWLRAGVAG